MSGSLVQTRHMSRSFSMSHSMAPKSVCDHPVLHRKPARGLEVEMVRVEAEVHDSEQNDEAAGNVRIELHEDGESGNDHDKELFHEENEPREANVVELGSPSEFAHFMGGKRKRLRQEATVD